MKSKYTTSARGVKLLAVHAAIMLSWGVSAAYAAPLAVYVSPQGSDANAGTSGSPVASFEKALQLISDNNAGVFAGSKVVVGAGTYYMPGKGIALGPQHSGRSGAPFVIEGASGELPVISGGRQLTGLSWRYDALKGIYTAKLPASVTGAISKLYVNGKEQVLARHPNVSSSYDPKKSYPVAPYILGGNLSDAKLNEYVAEAQNPVGAVKHLMHSSDWGTGFFEVVAFANKVPTWSELLGNNRPVGKLGSHDFRNKGGYVDNLKEALDAEGEWYHDRSTNELLYKPPAGTNLATAKIETAETGTLFSFTGDISNPVHDIKLSRLKITHTATDITKSTERLLRSDWKVYRGGAVFLENTQAIQVTDNDMVDMGGNVVFVSGYNNKVEISRNRIANAGGTAVAFVGQKKAVRSGLDQYESTQPLASIDLTPGPKTEDYPRDSLVENNLIRDIGQVDKQATGVQLSISSKITVRNNSIFDVPRAGINVNEGTFGGHVIEYNDVFNTVLETGDHGAYNSWGRDRFWDPNPSEMAKRSAANPNLPFLDVINPITLRNNRFKTGHGWDIDLDDGSSNYIIESNVLLGNGLKNREGFKRLSKNNILVNDGFHPHVWFKNSLDRFEKNIVMAAISPAAMAQFLTPNDPWGYSVNYNFYTSDPLLASSRNQNRFIELNSSVLVPAFRNAAAGDFTVVDGSPLLAQGFVNFPMDRFGVQEPRLKSAADYKTPSIPPISNTVFKPEALTTLGGAKAKSVQTLGEQSAVGLPSVSGVFIDTAPVNSDLYNAGIRNGDAITQVKLNGVWKPVKNIKDLREAWRLNPVSLEVAYYQQQKEQTTTINWSSTMYNNTAPDAVYNGSWLGNKTGRKAGDWGDDVNPTYVAGANVEIRFTGTGIRVYGPADNSAMTASVDLKPESGTYAPKDPAVRPVTSQYTPFATLSEVTGLPYGTYVLRMTKATGPYLQIDAWEVLKK